MPHEPNSTRSRRQPRIAPDKILAALIRVGGLEIDELGRIWRTKVQRCGNLYDCERKRAEFLTPLGYLTIKGMVDGERWFAGAHRIVWFALFGPIPKGMVINHINGIKADNRPENLEIVSPSGNSVHAHRVGLIDQYGERNPAAKLSDRQVASIRVEYASGRITQVELARQHGVTFQTISDIVRGTSRGRQLGPVSLKDHRRTFCERDPITGRFTGR